MKLLIDTCNVLHRTGILPPDLAGIDESGLVDLLQKSRYQNLNADFMCDGPQIGEDGRSRSGAMSSCYFHFAGRNQSADTLIINAVKASSSPRRLLVVSSDRRIQAEARKRRCRVISADDFLEQLTQDAAWGRRRAGSSTPDHLPRSTDYWLKEFGVDHPENPSVEKSAPIEPPQTDPSIEPPPTSDISTPPPPAKPREPGATELHSDHARWQRLMAEADRLWKAHEEEAGNHPA